MYRQSHQSRHRRLLISFGTHPYRYREAPVSRCILFQVCSVHNVNAPFTSGPDTFLIGHSACVSHTCIVAYSSVLPPFTPLHRITSLLDHVPHNTSHWGVLVLVEVGSGTLSQHRRQELHWVSQRNAMQSPCGRDATAVCAATSGPAPDSSLQTHGERLARANGTKDVDVVKSAPANSMRDPRMSECLCKRLSPISDRSRENLDRCHKLWSSRKCHSVMAVRLLFVCRRQTRMWLERIHCQR